MKNPSFVKLDEKGPNVPINVIKNTAEETNEDNKLLVVTAPLIPSKNISNEFKEKLAKLMVSKPPKEFKGPETNTNNVLEKENQLTPIQSEQEVIDNSQKNFTTGYIAEKTKVSSLQDRLNKSKVKKIVTEPPKIEENKSNKINEMARLLEKKFEKSIIILFKLLIIRFR